MFFKTIKNDIKIVFDRDPAARSVMEVLICYPGLHALFFHRIAHMLWRRPFKLISRIISHISRALTGIEIHPGARIGKRFFIDHGMGVVIGETVQIGDDVTLYQGVTLGGTSWTHGRRHPCIEDKVVIGASAAVLGPVTVGQDSRIGSSSVVIHDVPAHSTVVGIPGRVVRLREPIVDNTCAHHYNLQHATLPDPFSDMISGLRKSVDELNQRLMDIERKTP